MKTLCNVVRTLLVILSINVFCADYASCQGKSVFLGDSMLYGFNNFPEYLDGDVANLAVTTSKSNSVVQTVNSAARYNPTSLFIMTGINDVADANPLNVAANYETILDTSASIMPKATVYVHALFPVNWSAFPQRYQIGNNDIAAFNGAIYDVVKSRQNVVYLDFRAAFTDSSGNLKRELSSDGLHLNRDGYKIWGELLAPYL